MRKVLSIMLIACMLFAIPAFAGQEVKTIIDAVTLDNDPTSTSSGYLYVGHYKRLAFFWSYDETEVGGGVSGALTMEIAPTSTDRNLSASFYDYAGGATLQTTESLAADGWYYCWWNNDLPVPYVNITITGTATDVDDTILTSVYMVGEK